MTLPTATVTDPRTFTVTFGMDNEPSREWAEKLPRWWRIATIDRSRLEVVEGKADITILVFTGPGRPEAHRGTGGTGLITIYPPYSVVAFLHELSHVRGCCRGEGTDGSHFITGEPGIMSDPVCADCLLFSDRELRAMGID